MARGQAADMSGDDYTPYGYLDLPGHTRYLSPRGVLRSHDVGFRWHFPAYATGYGGRRETYRAGLRVGLDDAVTLADFDRVVAPYHSKNIVRFEASCASSRMDVEFFAVDDDVLCAFVQAVPVRRVSFHAGYLRLVAADQGWGESGLVARRWGDRLVLQGFEDGEAFVLEVEGAQPQFVVQAGEDAASSTGQGDVDSNSAHPVGSADLADPADLVTVLGRPGEQVGISGALIVTPSGPTPVTCAAYLARGRTVDEAHARLAQARRSATVVRAGLLADDEQFWSRAPVLEGDWPDHWRRGLVYDLETVRMMVRPPAGIYSQPWDAMQIQSPRVVLGEAAIDALLLAYADPEAAQALIYGTFADAPMPNVPCSREDGSYNMVSADGSVCGTGPQWGYPWFVVRLLHAWRPGPGLAGSALSASGPLPRLVARAPARRRWLAGARLQLGVRPGPVAALWRAATRRRPSDLVHASGRPAGGVRRRGQVDGRTSRSSLATTMTSNAGTCSPATTTSGPTGCGTAHATPTAEVRRPTSPAWTT